MPIEDKIIIQPPRYGLVIEERDTDWVMGSENKRPVGAIVNRPIINPTGDWTKYNPTYNTQATEKFDPYSCVSESITNALEQRLNQLMEQDPSVRGILTLLKALDSNGNAKLSARFLAVMSGTVPGVGNSQGKVFDALRTYGICGEEICPKMEDMSQPEYFRITAEMKRMALKFYEYFNKVEYESVSNGVVPTPAQLQEALTKAPVVLCVGGTVLGKVGAQLYRANGAVSQYTHQVNHFNQKENVSYFSEVIPKVLEILDTYVPFIKPFQKDYPFGYAKAVFLTLKKKARMKYKIFGKNSIFVLDPVEKKLVPYGSGKVYKTIEGTVDYTDIIEVPNLNALKAIAPLADWMITSSDWDREEWEASLS